MKNKQELIAKLAQNESLVSELYDLYSQIFENKAFWKKLCEEEKLHFEWIQSFNKYAKDFDITIDDFRFKLPKVNECMDAVKRMIFKVSETSLDRAFKNALVIESELVEENYFSVFKSTRSSINEVLRQLEMDTHRHINQIKNEQKKLEDERK